MNVISRSHAALRQAGFTLIELMIAVAIVAILAAVAMPSYNSYVRRGQLTEAFTLLADMRVKMEQYYQDNKYYGVNAGSTTCPTLAPAYTAFPYAAKNFSIICTLGAAPSQTFLLRANGTGGLTTGFDYTLNEQGTKGTAQFAHAASTAVCWLSKAAGCDN
jgi:type IV pilus assembly protein PilE